MAFLHGRRGRLYVGLATSTAAAEPLPGVTNWTLKAETDKVEVTAMGDSNKSYVSGIPDASGTFSGHYDNASAQTYTAASDGAARRFYLYPDNTVNTAGPYWFGTAIFDFNAEGAVDGKISISGSWAAASAVAKVG